MPGHALDYWPLSSEPVYIDVISPTVSHAGSLPVESPSLKRRGSPDSASGAEDGNPCLAKRCRVESERDLLLESLEINRKILQAMLAVQRDIARIANVIDK